jgi:hypothetical protein
VFTARYGLGLHIQFSSIFVSEVLGRYPSETIHLFYSTLQCVSIILYTNSLFTNTKTTSECFSRLELQKNQLDVSMQTFISTCKKLFVLALTLARKHSHEGQYTDLNRNDDKGKVERTEERQKKCSV